MNRKEFLKLTSTAAVGTPFLLNGMTTQAMTNFLDAPLICDGVNDRVLIIIRMAGANDGLNTVIPISQYNDYVALRPNLHIKDTGLNPYINLDSSLPSNQLSGLHPSLTGFKSLYDNGKLGLLNGVGYPSPNFSHFKSENTMFAGKDGNTNGTLDSGIFGRYLGALDPGLAGNPTPDKKDPLAVQFGNTNPSLFYGHSHEIGVEYNVSNFQDDLFGNLALRTLPSSSEYKDLLDYINAVEVATDSYYNRINYCFNNGSNSSTVYPNSSLAKQLKTVARLIQGGSKTKIFQVNLGGFDTHVNQIVSGSAHTGAHNNLISDISDSIMAFQSDIETLGIANKIMTVTFSEFGREVRENGNLGTDHGTLSPFFVVGSNVEAGVYGAHPQFTNTTDFQYSETERRYDYRQLFATLMQDWLGAGDVLMQEAALDSFTGINKIPLITALANAYPNCLADPGDCEDSIITVAETVDAGWTYYAVSGTTDYLFGIEHTPTGTGANTNLFSATVTLQKACNTNLSTVHEKATDSQAEGIFAQGYYWNIVITSGSLNGWVNLRWFSDAVLEQDLSTAAQSFQTSSGASHQSPILHLQAKVPLTLPTHLSNDNSGISAVMIPLLNSITGAYLGNNYTQYNTVNTIDNTGGGLFIKVTNLTENTEFLDPATVTGTIRFNSHTKKLEGFDGRQWKTFH